MDIQGPPQTIRRRFLVIMKLFKHKMATTGVEKFTAGSAFSFLRAVGFSSRQFLRYEPETSGIDVTLLGAHNDIRSIRSANGNMPN